MEDLRDEGLIDRFGLTGIGHADSLRLVMRSDRFSTIQAPFHWLNPSALIEVPSDFTETNYGGFLRDAHELEMGIFAIRVFAAGALLDMPPSMHTQMTPFFPLSLYERDRAHAARLRGEQDSESPLADLSLRYVLSQPEIASALIGFGAVTHVEDALRVCLSLSGNPVA